MSREDPPQGSSRPEEVPRDEPADAAALSIDGIADVYARALDLFGRLEDECDERDRAELQAAADPLKEAFHGLLELDVGGVDSPDQAVQIVSDALDLVERTNERILGRVSEEDDGPVFPPGTLFCGEAPQPRNQIYLEVMRMGPGPPSPPVDPGTVVEFLRALIAALKELLVTLRAQNGGLKTRAAIKSAEEMIKLIEETIEAIRSGAIRTTLSWVYRWVIGFCRWVEGIIETVGRRVLRSFLVRVGGVIVSFLKWVGGAYGAELGVAATGAGAAALGAGVIAAMIAAFGAGCLIGYWIGKVKLGEKTVEDWIADGAYKMIWAPSDDCSDLLAAYLQARNLRRTYENSAPTLDKSIMAPLLAAEVAILEQYLAKPCDPDTAGVYRRELARLKAYLARLTR